MEFAGYSNLNDVIKESIFNTIPKLNSCVTTVLMPHCKIYDCHIVINKLMKNVLLLSVL